MVKTLLTTYDVTNILTNILKYNDESILIIDEDGVQTNHSMVEYLNLELYAWKNRLVHQDTGLTPFDAWSESLEYTIGKSYGLVEITNNEVTVSKDIDCATLSGRCTIIVPTDKVENLEHYLLRLRNLYTGAVQDIVNSNGDMIKAYINLGILLYDGEPSMTPIGECVQVSFNFTIEYLTSVVTYDDLPMEFGIDGVFYPVPYTKMTRNVLFNGEQVSSYQKPTRSGQINQTATCVINVSMFDFNNDLNGVLDDIFWSVGAKTIGTEDVGYQNVNYPITVRVTRKGKQYVYDMLLTNFTQDIENSSFVTSALTLVPNGKGD